MSNDTIIPVCGNMTADPELKFLPSGVAVVNFTIASTPRYFDKQSNEWKDGETLFFRSSAFRGMAEEIAERLTKGQPVLALGKLKARTFQTKEGGNRTSWDLMIDEIGPAIRPPKGGGNGRPPAQSTPASTGGGWGSATDSWGGEPSSGGSWGTPDNNEPPF